MEINQFQVILLITSLLTSMFNFILAFNPGIFVVKIEKIDGATYILQVQVKRKTMNPKCLRDGKRWVGH